MEPIYLVIPGKISNNFAEIIKIATEDYKTIIIDTFKDLPDLKNKKIVFAVELDECGLNISLFTMLLRLKENFYS